MLWAMTATRISPHASRRRICLGLLAGSLLAACASTPTSPAGPLATSPGQPVHLTGRFAISETRSLPETRTSHQNGRFRLDRTAEGTFFELYSPFGQTVVRAAQAAGQPAWLETARKQRYTGNTLDDVLKQAIGIPIPASRLPDWLSDRFRQVVERSADGSRIRAREEGWNIERSDRRWFLNWHQNDYRLDIRLVVDEPGHESSAPRTEPARHADTPGRLPPAQHPDDHSTPGQSGHQPAGGMTTDFPPL